MIILWRFSLVNVFAALILSFIFNLTVFAQMDAGTDANANANADTHAYRFAVFPALRPSQIEKAYGPVALEFQRALQRPVVFRSAGSFEKFQQKIRQQSYDIVLVQPFDYVLAHDYYGYLPVARRNAELSAIFLIKKDSNIQSITDLKGSKVASPPQISAVANMAKKALLQSGLNVDSEISMVYKRSHLSCMQKVLLGDVQVCVTTPTAYKLAAKKIATQELKVIYKTPPIPHALYAVHQRVKKADRLKIKAILLSMNHSNRFEDGQSDRFEFIAASDQDYYGVRHFWDKL